MPKCAGRSVADLLRKNYTNYININNMVWLMSSTKSELNRYDAIGGHIAYQFVSMLKQFKHITILRDPLERTISQYNHFMTMQTSIEEAEILKLHNYSFMDFVSTKNPNLSLWTNVYNVYLGDDGNVTYDVQEYLERAIIALNELDFVGIYEQMDETIDALKERYNLEGEMDVIGKTPHGNKSVQLTDEEAIEAKKWLTPDYVLYNMAKERFNEGESWKD